MRNQERQHSPGAKTEKQLSTKDNFSKLMKVHEDARESEASFLK